MEGHLDVVKFLLERGVDPNVRNNPGDTPLHYAAERGHLDVVKFLLERGADPNVRKRLWQYAVALCGLEGPSRDYKVAT